MEKFLVLYCMPAAGLDEWMKTDPETRKATEQDLQKKWQEWMGANGAHLKETAGAGKTKRVTSDGAMDARNDIMLYSLVEAASHDEAAKLFEGHPHLEIPGSWIEVMTAKLLPGMQ